MMGYYGGWGMMWWFGGLCLLLVVIGLIVLGVALMRGSQTMGRGVPAGPTLDTLRRRFAAGELSSEEFERMRQTLSDRPERV